MITRLRTLLQPDRRYLIHTVRVREDGQAWFAEWPNSAKALSHGHRPGQTGDRIEYTWDRIRDWPRSVMPGFVISTSPEQTGAASAWPRCRIFALSSVERVARDEYGRFYARAMTLGAEIPTWRAFGPGGEAVPALIDEVAALSLDECMGLARWFVAHPPDREPALVLSFSQPDPLFTPLRAVSFRVQAALLQIAPEGVWDAYAAAHDKFRLDDPGWGAIQDAAWSYAAAMMREAPAERITFLSDQWRAARDSLAI